MTPGRADFEVPRNGSDQRLIQLLTLDEAGTEVPVDLTFMTVEAKARDIFGGTVFATAEVEIDSAVDGTISILWLGSQFDGYGDYYVNSIAAYDIKLVDESGVPSVPVRGLLNVTPEATA